MSYLKPIEASYPLSFRASDATVLGSYLKQHTSVVLIGVKRVGISNFLRFFLHHPSVQEEYVKNGPSLFVQVDLNELVERSPKAFWMLTLKRIVDHIESNDLPQSLLSKAKHIFAEAIQLQDPFLTYESVRKVCQLVDTAGFALTIFWIRFDRLQESLTSEFFANIQALKDAVGPQLCFVFTSHRPLPDLMPEVITKQSLAVFARDVYLKPAENKDMEIILETLLERYDMKLSPEIKKVLLVLAGGHVQYLQLALLKIKNDDGVSLLSSEDIQSSLESDEELIQLSEEILESLHSDEQSALCEVANNKKIEVPPYLLQTGLIKEKEQELLNTLFSAVVKSNTKTENSVSVELTKKELCLYELLLAHVDTVIERDDIIDAVWPEQAELGVSDWALDRLVARLRNKLKLQQSQYQVVTVVSRGYKLAPLA